MDYFLNIMWGHVIGIIITPLLIGTITFYKTNSILLGLLAWFVSLWFISSIYNVGQF